jgi:CDP-glucose 4,6-dehydratase
MQLGARVSGLSFLEPVSSPDLFSSLQFGKAICDIRGNVVDSEVFPNAINKGKPEIIFHLAAKAANKIKAIVVVTTDKCYENQERDYAYLESDVLGGHDPYSSSKACAKHVTSAYYRSFFLDKV